VIGSSTDTHADLIQRGRAAGKHIFCEKPVDLTSSAHACAKAVERAGVVCMIGFQRRFDPTFSALKARLDAGEIGTPEVLIVTSRDPGAPPVEYIKHSGGIFKDMLIHDFDIFRWILDDEASAACDRQLPDRPGDRSAGDIDTTAVTIRTKKRAALPDQYLASRRLWLRPALRSTRQQGHAAGRQCAADRSGCVRRRSVASDLPEAFFLERYRAAYAAEIAHFFDAAHAGQAGAHHGRRWHEGARTGRSGDARWRDGRPVSAR
jgi:myo-inositol 2-dehydrogenase/D-chiro-inositol 1-dehydrogenase